MRSSSCGLVLLLVGANCGSTRADDGALDAVVDASPVAPGFFRVDGNDYPLRSAEAYRQGAQLIVRGSGDAAGRCDPTLAIACYELVVTLPVDAAGSVDCTGTTKLTLLIDGGTSATFIAGQPFGGACNLSVDAVGDVSQPVVLGAIEGTLIKVSDVERNTPISMGALTATRSADRP